MWIFIHGQTRQSKPGLRAHHRGLILATIVHKKTPLKTYFTSAWSPSRSLWDRDPFVEGCRTQELKHYPLGLPWLIQTRPIEHRLLPARTRWNRGARVDGVTALSVSTGDSESGRSLPSPSHHHMLCFSGVIDGRAGPSRAERCCDAFKMTAEACGASEEDDADFVCRCATLT